MADVPTNPTLHHAWLNRDEWLMITSITEAMLSWSEETGWVLMFRDTQSPTAWYTHLVFHREQELEGHSWPNGWLLRDLAQLKVTTWEEHRRARKRARRQPAWQRHARNRYF